MDIKELQACTFSFVNLNFAKCCLRAKLKAEHSLSVLWLKMHGCSIRFYSRHEVVTLFEQNGYRPQRIQRSGPIYMAAAKP